MKNGPTHEDRLIELLNDGHWHSGREMAIKVSHRFGGYLFTMKQHGYKWEKRLDPERPTGQSWWQYRLTGVPGACIHIDEETGQTRLESS